MEVLGVRQIKVLGLANNQLQTQAPNLLHTKTAKVRCLKRISKQTSQ